MNASMRDSQIQTPQTDRRAKFTPHNLSKKHLKIAGKSLHPAFAAFSLEESPRKSGPSSSPTSEVPVDHDHFSESVENFTTPSNPLSTHSSESLTVSDPSPSSSSSMSSIITSNNASSADLSVNKYENGDLDSSKKMECIETDIVIRHLRNVRIQILNEEYADSSRKLLDALLKIIIDEFHSGVYNDKGWLKELFTSKTRLASLSFMLGILAAVAAFSLLNLGEENRHAGATLT